jgi:hypothetical protein
MKTGLSIVAAVAALALPPGIAAQTPPPPGPQAQAQPAQAQPGPRALRKGKHSAKKCKKASSGPTTCTVDVSVAMDAATCTAAGAAAPCILVGTDILLAQANSKPTIKWKLTPQTDARFVFSTTAGPGIDFGPGAAAEFTCAVTAGSNDREYGCKYQQIDQNAGWKYDIRIVDKTGAITLDPLDPWVIND